MAGERLVTESWGHPGEGSAWAGVLHGILAGGDCWLGGGRWVGLVEAGEQGPMWEPSALPVEAPEKGRK